MPVEMTPVKSTAVRKIGYDQETKELFIEYVSGHTYKIDNVAQVDYHELTAAPSLGKHLPMITRKYGPGVKVSPALKVAS